MQFQSILILAVAAITAVALPLPDPNDSDASSPTSNTTYKLSFEQTDKDGEVSSAAALPGRYAGLDWWGVSTNFCTDNCPVTAASFPLSLHFTPDNPARLSAGYSRSHVSSVAMMSFAAGCVASLPHLHYPHPDKPGVVLNFDQPINCSIVLRGWQHDLPTGEPDIEITFEYSPMTVPNRNFYDVPTAGMTSFLVGHEMYGMRTLSFTPVPLVAQDAEAQEWSGFHALMDDVEYRIRNVTAVFD